MEHGEELRVACGEVLVGFVPLLALLPPGLRETYACGIAFGLEAELCRGAMGADVGELVRCERRDDELLLRDEAQDGAASGASAWEMAEPVAARTQIDGGTGREPGH